MDLRERRGQAGGYFAGAVPEGLRPPGNFTVRAEGTDTIYGWLKLHDAAAKNPLIRPAVDSMGNQLPLGVLDLEDGGVLQHLQSGIGYNKDTLLYELSSGFVSSVGSSMRNIFSSMQEARDAMLAAMTASDTGKTPPVSLPDLKKALEQTPGINEYALSQDKQDKALLIIPKHHNDEQGMNGVFVIHGIEHPVATGHCLHVRGKVNETPEAFRQNYQQLAQLTKYVIQAIYALKNGHLPDSTYVTAPPENTADVVASIGNAIAAQKRMLSATGIIDGDDDLADEIRSKICLERKPNKTFADVGGCEKAKEELSTVVQALRNPSLYREWGTKPPRGVLLYGEPGTGKTLLAKALANTADASIYLVKIADVLHSLYGRTERLIQAIFNEAQKNAPVIIFIDEIDALAGHRNFSTEVTSRIVSVLQTCLDGLEERDGRIIVIGATNRLDAIDSSLLRPGRFDTLVEVPLPEQPQRKKIFTIHIDAAEKISGRKCFDPALNLDVLSSDTHTDRFSGADIEELVRRRLAKKVSLQAQGHNPGLVTTEELIEDIATYERVRLAKARHVTGFRGSAN